MPTSATAPTTRLRVDGRELRCKVVGEGGNLGLTQLGRVEAAQHGVLLNTDFIDNSAGVDTSDHEVNIKILLNGEVQKKKLTLRGAQQAAGVDDRRSRRAGAQRQLPPEPGDQPDGTDERVAPGLQAALHPHAGIAGPARPPDRIPAVRCGTRRAQGARPGTDAAGAVGAAVVFEAGGRSSSCSSPTCRKIRTCRRNWCAISRSRCRRSTPRRWNSTA